MIEQIRCTKSYVAQNSGILYCKSKMQKNLMQPRKVAPYIVKLNTPNFKQPRPSCTLYTISGLQRNLLLGQSTLQNSCFQQRGLSSKSYITPMNIGVQIVGDWKKSKKVLHVHVPQGASKLQSVKVFVLVFIQ